MLDLSLVGGRLFIWFNFFFISCNYIYPSYLFLKKNKQLKDQIISTKVEKATNVHVKEGNGQCINTLDKKNSIIENIKLVLTLMSSLITSFLPQQLHIFC